MRKLLWLIPCVLFGLWSAAILADDSLSIDSQTQKWHSVEADTNYLNWGSSTNYIHFNSNEWNNICIYSTNLLWDMSTCMTNTMDFRTDWRCIVKFRVKQIEFVLPVDYQMYKDLSVGQIISNNFVSGSTMFSNPDPLEVLEKNLVEEGNRR